MKSLLYRLLFGRVRLRPAKWHDWRQPWEIDQWWGLLFRAKVNRNVFERGSLATRITHDPDYLPPWVREELPAILRRQAA